MQILYVHGKDGSAGESEHYKPLFPNDEVIGLDYHTFSPWETGLEILAAVDELARKHEDICLIANSIGAFFSMNAEIDGLIQKAYFISPIVDMEKLIMDMMKWANVTEAELEAQGIIHTEFGEDLSWEYLSYVKRQPIKCIQMPKVREVRANIETHPAFGEALEEAKAAGVKTILIGCTVGPGCLTIDESRISVDL